MRQFLSSGRRRYALLLLVVGAGSLAIMGSSCAPTKPPPPPPVTFTVMPNPSSVESSVTAASVTPCPAGTVEVDVQIFEANAAIPSGGILQAVVPTQNIGNDGSWSITSPAWLAAPTGNQPGAVPGDATFSASCFNGPNDGTSQVLQTYDNVPFTINDLASG
jgi:hypothetical protein